MALIAPNVCRFRVVGDLFGEDCVNIFDIDIDVTPGNTRADDIPSVAGDLLNQWNDHILPALSAGYTALRVEWVDLDSAAGVTGSISSTDGSNWPEAGGVEGQALPNNTYVKVVKLLEGKNRQQRNGTLRLGGIPESYTIGANGNVLDPTQVGGLNDRFEDLKDGINGLEGGADQNLVVVHTVNGNYTGKSQIAQYSVAGTVGTLRRRMPGYGD